MDLLSVLLLMLYLMEVNIFNENFISKFWSTFNDNPTTELFNR